MMVIDPGHVYELDHLDGTGKEILTFVKREGDGYPGNVGHHPGTNLQEVMRALIDRVQYLDRQIHDSRNTSVIEELQTALWRLEWRAAERHGRPCPDWADIEKEPTCKRCGHVGCQGACRHD